MRGATLHLGSAVGAISISIHAPREGSDVQQGDSTLLIVISIHAPREGSDDKFDALPAAIKQFLSTLPVRGATLP